MTRKRGKSRLSYATKRAERWRGKYVVDCLTKRPKILLPVMYPQLREALINWDYLETILFPVFEALGIPLDKYPFYLAWAKRKAESGLKFTTVTQALEWLLLEDEFEARGLNPEWLVELEPYVEYWVRLIKGEPSNFEELPVESIVFNAWLTVGASPYLDKDDEDTNKIYCTSLTYQSYIAELVNSSRVSGSPKKVECGCTAKKVNVLGTIDPVISLSLWHSVDGWIGVRYITLSIGSYTKYVFDTDYWGTPLKDRFNTPALINSARLRVVNYDMYYHQPHVTYGFIKVLW